MTIARRHLPVFGITLWLAAYAAGSDERTRDHPELRSSKNSSIIVRRLAAAPTISDFEGMQPRGAAREMSVVSNFIQSDPSDGQPATQKTEVYLGFTDKNLYLVWLCFDNDPGKIRAHLVRRENIYDDVC